MNVFLMVGAALTHPLHTIGGPSWCRDCARGIDGPAGRIRIAKMWFDCIEVDHEEGLHVSIARLFCCDRHAELNIDRSDVYCGMGRIMQPLHSHGMDRTVYVYADEEDSFGEKVGTASCASGAGKWQKPALMVNARQQYGRST